jgi:hypothetical protein
MWGEKMASELLLFVTATTTAAVTADLKVSSCKLFAFSILLLLLLPKLLLT